MSRYRLAVLGSVSFITLLAAGAGAATGPTMNLGHLKPQDQWKVGTVEANGAAYCAMVSRFEKQVVLAFARNPDGYGSLAMDFREKFFTPGRDYEVTLKPQGGKTRRLEGRASSDRSVVVQIGKDEALFGDLARGGKVDIGLPTIDASFALKKFEGAYDDLVRCAGGLAEKSAMASPPAVKVAAVEQDPLDAQLESITASSKEAAPARETADGFRAIEAQLDRAAEEEAAASARKLAELDTRKSDLESKIVWEQEKAPEKTALPAQPGRKLLASARDVAPDVKPAPFTGFAARLLDRKEAGAKPEDTAKIAAEVEAKQKELDALAAARAKEAEERVAAFGRRDAELNARIVKAEKQRDEMAARLAKADADNKAVMAQLVKMQDQVAELKAERGFGTEKLARSLAEAQDNYEARIAALTTERDGLKTRLAEAEAANKAAQTRIAALDTRLAAMEEEVAGAAQVRAERDALKGKLDAALAASEAEKKDLNERLQALDRQNKLLQAALGEQQARLAEEKGKARDAAALEAKLAGLEKSHAARAAELQGKLEAAEGRYAALKQENEAIKAADAGKTRELAEAKGLIARLQERVKAFEIMKTAEAPKAADTAEVASLRRQLQEVETARAAEAARAAAAREELDAARRQIAVLGDGFAPVAPAVSSLGEKLAPSERAELEEYRRRAAQGQPLASAQAPAREIVAPSVAAAPVPAVEKVAEASADLTAPPAMPVLPKQRRKIAAVSDRGVPTLTEPPFMAAQAEASVTPAPKVAEAAPQVAVKAPLTAAAPSAAALAEVEPAAGVAQAAVAPVVPATPAGGIVWDEPQVAIAVPPVRAKAVEEAAPPPAPVAPPVVEAAVNAAPPVVAAPPAPVVAARPAPVVADPAPSRQAQAMSPNPMSSNRAAAFLDKVMSFHRPGTAPKAEAAPAAPVVKAEIAPTLAADAPIGEPVVEAPAQARRAPLLSVAAEVSPPTLLDDNMTPPPVSSSAGASGLDASLLAGIETGAGRAAAPVSLDKLLPSAGLKAIAYVPAADANVRQWSSGVLNGMMEKAPATGNFLAQVQEYLDRYREDCPGQLKTGVGPVQATAAGKSVVAEASCAMPSNAYVSSFVFSEKDGTFNAILHTALPSDAAEAKRAGEKVAAVLRASGGVEVEKTAEAVGLRLNVPKVEASAAPVPVTDDFETAIIE